LRLLGQPLRATGHQLKSLVQVIDRTTIHEDPAFDLQGQGLSLSLNPRVAYTTASQSS
jgi:hypothetical protein